MALLLWAYPDKIIGSKLKLWSVLWRSALFSFAFSSALEFIQLFVHLGTWQLSDLIYNTLGGIIGGVIYWVIKKLNRRNKRTSDTDIKDQ